MRATGNFRLTIDDFRYRPHGDLLKGGRSHGGLLQGRPYTGAVARMAASHRTGGGRRMVASYNGVEMKC
jgi:hypothetical protein